jgi:hypothetical protein
MTLIELGIEFADLPPEYANSAHLVFQTNEKKLDFVDLD